jgi:gas vesicle protein
MDELNNSVTPEPDQSWKMKTLLIGGALGALVGVGAAFLLTQRAEQQGKTLAISPTKGVQLGVMIAGLLRSILNLGD